MIKVLSLAAALALLPLSAALAQDAQGTAEARLEAAAESFEAKMEEFGERAEAISGNKSLSEEQKEQRIAVLWSEYEPALSTFTAQAAELASKIAGEALAEIDVEAIVQNALAEVDLSGLAQMAGGFATNSAFASGDPEHMATMGLVADYAVGEAADSMEEIEIEVEAGAAVEPASPANPA